jgi:hypothetical protein
VATPVLNARNIETHKILDQRQLPDSATTLYTVPGSTQAVVESIKLVNTSGSQVTGIRLLTGGTADANQLYSDLTLGANEGIEYKPELHLGTGNTIVGVAGTAAAITCTIDGVEVTP